MSSQFTAPTAARRGLDTIIERTEPSLNPGKSGQIVRLLGGIGCHHRGAWWHGARYRGAGIAHHDRAGTANGICSSTALGAVSNVTRGMHPKCAIAVQALAVEERRNLHQLLGRNVRAAQHHEI